MNKFYKVKNHGNGCVYSTFFNPVTEEEYRVKVWDIDDVRVEQEMAKEYLEPINKTALTLYNKLHKILEIGCKVEIQSNRQKKERFK